MPDISEKNTGKNSLRPLLIAVLSALALFLSLLFLLSPEASSDSEEAPRGEVISQRAPVEPKESRFDFRLTENHTFYNVMNVMNVPGPEIHEIVKKAKEIYDLRNLRQDTVLRVFTLEDKVNRIEYKFDDYSILVVERGEEGFRAQRQELANEIKEVSVSGTIDNSLFEDAVKAGADPHAVMELTDIFSWDIDFASDIRKGDTFNVLYEALYVEGEPVRAVRVLGAEMVNGGKKYNAVYFNEGKYNGYYDLEGKSLRRTLLKSPLRFRRITSYFSRARFHPIHKRYRPHHGIDYGAPIGTPIEAAGSGVVRFAGWKGGYGNFIEIRHSNNYSTAYGHLSKIRKGIRAGAKITQGDVIGYVGSTGISTGPHLHYEVRLGKRLINPLSIKSVPDAAVAKKDMAVFASVRDGVSRKLEASTAVASAPGAPDSDYPISKISYNK